ncbi:MAG TPA: LptA/OstA family protein [Desulfobaccales bacterium]|nr:LptA/OstA family protein [Desulfobaccales bacterium]
MRSLRLLLLAGLLVLGLASGSTAYGAAPKKPSAAADVPLRITATHLEADQQTGVIVFSGQVKAQYGDSTLYAQQLRVYFKAKPKPAPRAKSSRENPAQSPLEALGAEKIDRIVARGNVRFVQGDRVATGQEAIYYKDRNEVVLKGNPQLWRAENTLKGERIILNLNTNKVMVESSPHRRVEALLYSKGSAGGKASLPFGSKAHRERQP